MILRTSDLNQLKRKNALIERDFIDDVLLKHKGNKSKAAHELGIARTTLISRLERLKMRKWLRTK